MKTLILPLQPLYNFNFDTSIDDNIYKFTCIYNRRTELLSMSINDNNGNTLINGIQLTSGTNNISQYNLPFDEILCVNNKNPKENIKVEELGVTSFVIVRLV